MSYKMMSDIREQRKVAKYLWYNSENNLYWSVPLGTWVDEANATRYTNDERLASPEAIGPAYWTKA